MTAKKSFSPAGQLWFSQAGENVLNESRIALLEKIEETGSITQAGKAVGISYRTAWITIDHLNSIADSPLVERTTGGKRGGGTQLTSHGQNLVKAYRTIQTEHAKYIERLRHGIEDFDRFLHLTRKIALKTSARNQVFGVVESIRKDSLNAIVELNLKSGDKLISQITLAGLESLGLRKGEEAYALIKANWICLEHPQPSKKGKASHKKTSNQLIGKIISIQKGENTAEVVIRLKGGNNLVSVLSLKSLRDLKLELGKAICVKFNASDVILGIAR